MLAAASGHTPVVKLLVEAGADKGGKSHKSKRTALDFAKSKRKALDFAKQNGQAECAEILNTKRP